MIPQKKRVTRQKSGVEDFIKKVYQLDHLETKDREPFGFFRHPFSFYLAENLVNNRNILVERLTEEEISALLYDFLLRLSKNSYNSIKNQYFYYFFAQIQRRFL